MCYRHLAVPSRTLEGPAVSRKDQDDTYALERKLKHVELSTLFGEVFLFYCCGYAVQLVTSISDVSLLRGFSSDFRFLVPLIRSTKRLIKSRISWVRLGSVSNSVVKYCPEFPLLNEQIMRCTRTSISIDHQNRKFMFFTDFSFYQPIFVASMELLYERKVKSCQARQNGSGTLETYIEVIKPHRTFFGSSTFLQAAVARFWRGSKIY